MWSRWYWAAKLLLESLENDHIYSSNVRCWGTIFRWYYYLHINDTRNMKINTIQFTSDEIELAVSYPSNVVYPAGTKQWICCWWILPVDVISVPCCWIVYRLVQIYTRVQVAYTTNDKRVQAKVHSTCIPIFDVHSQRSIAVVVIFGWEM